MAINPETKYPGKINPSDADYPFGSARNITTPGDGTGTPWEAALVNDIFGFIQAALNASSQVPTGDSEKVGASQVLKAITSVTDNVATAKAAKLPTGHVIQTKGRTSVNDGGGAFYLTRTPAEFGGTPDEQGASFTMDNGNILVRVGPADIRQFGVVLDGVADGTAGVVAALAAEESIEVPGPLLMTPDTSDAVTIMNGLNKLRFRAPSKLQLPDSNGVDIAMTSRVELTNETLMNLEIEGEDTSSATATAINQTGGAATNYVVDYTLDDASGVDVGDYVLITTAAGTGDFEAANGCFKVTAKVSNTITVKHTYNNAWPTMTLTNATVWPLKTVLRWPADTIGMVIAGAHLRTLAKVVLAGAYNVSTTPPADGPVDGLQVGSASNTPETGLNESERQPAGSLWAARIGIVEWDANGVQVVSGHAYMVAASACSNGWRGFQAAGSGSLSVKGASAIGNGASGFESEGNGFTNANNSVSCGNHQQGYYAIGGTSLSASNSVALGNVTHGYDSRNGATLGADQSTSKDNTVNGLNCLSAFILFGSGATSSGNGNEDTEVLEGGTVNGNGASSLGNFNVDFDSGATLINESGDKLPIQRWDPFPTDPVFQNVTVTTDNSTGEFCQIGKVVFWKIRMDYSGLDTGDLSPIAIDNLPVAMAGRNGGAKINIRSSTGLTFAATDTYQLDYNTVNDALVLVDSAGNLPLYNSGKIAAAGVIDLSGWYEVN